MITRLSGVLEWVSDGRAGVAPRSGDGSPGEVSYEVLIPGYFQARLLDRIGQHVTFRTLHHLEGVAQGTSFVPRLVGFPSVEDRAFFELLTTVKGLSTRKGLRALALPPSEIAAAIVREDEPALTKLPEIGKKLASTLVHELKEKATPWLTEGASIEPKAGSSRRSPVSAVPPGPGEEAVEALLALGETLADAERLVLRALGRDPALDSSERIITHVYAHR